MCWPQWRVAGSESSCAVTWLRNVYQFIVSSRERVRSLKTRQEAIELLARLKAARIRVPDVEQVCSMHMGGILEAVALPGQPSPEDVAFDQQRRELADLLKSKPSTGKLQLFLQSMDRRPCAERSEAEARLQAGLQWIQESLAVLDGSQNDPEVWCLARMAPMLRPLTKRRRLPNKSRQARSSLWT